MTTIDWVGPGGTASKPAYGSWQSASSWSSGALPATGDTAYLGGTGAYLVTIPNGGTDTVAGLVLKSSATLLVDSGGSLTDTSSLNNGGTIEVESGGFLDLGGTLSNSGTIVVESTSLDFGSTSSASATLSGAGRIDLADDAGILGSVTAATLDNINDKIDGAGYIGGGLSFTNEVSGIVDADGGGSGNGGYFSLTLETGQTITNYGTLEATFGALSIHDTVHNIAGGTASNPKGIIAARGNAFVELDDSTIQGGKVVTSGGGYVFVRGYDADDGTGSATLDGTGAAVEIDGTLYVDDEADLILRGSIINNGQIDLDAYSHYSNIDIGSSTVTLSGKGSINLSADGANGTIDALTAGDTLVNASTVSGAGTIGDTRLVLDNRGTIEAGTASATGSIALLFGQSGDVGNSQNEAGGIIEASGGSTLVMETVDSDQNASPFSYFTNGGTIRALAGGTVEIINILLTNITGNEVMTGGTLAAYADATLLSNTFAVASDAGTIILSGAGSVIEYSGSNSSSTLEQTLTDIAKGGLLEVIAKRDYTTSNALTLEGKLDLGGGVLSSGTITAATGSVLFGFGTVEAQVTAGGTIEAKGGTLDLTGAVTGKGAMKVESSAALELDAAVASTQTLTFVGTSDVLLLKDVADFKGTVAGLVATDTIDLAGLSASGAKAYYTANSGNTGGTLIVKNATTRDVIVLSGQYVAAGFHVAADSAGTGTALTYSAPAQNAAHLSVAHA